MAAALWRYGSLDVKRLKELEEENARLKRMYANLPMELDTAKYIIVKALTPGEKRRIIEESYTELLLQNNIRISMTESGDPLDNAIAERINGIIKHEYLKHYGPSNLEKATERLKQVVESYNERRPHLSIQMNTPNKVHHQKPQVSRQWKKSK